MLVRIGSSDGEVHAAGFCVSEQLDDAEALAAMGEPVHLRGRANATAGPGILGTLNAGKGSYMHRQRWEAFPRLLQPAPHGRCACHGLCWVVGSLSWPLHAHWCVPRDAVVGLSLPTGKLASVGRLRPDN